MLGLLVALFFLPIIAVRMFLPDPVFLPLFPLVCVLRRFKALLTPGGFEMKTRLFLLGRNLLLLLNQPFILLHWTIDDIVFSSYRSVEIVDPVFVVGGFRTGSTTLHRTLNKDEEQFETPRFLEMTLPFFWFYLFLDFIEWSDKQFNTSLVSGIENYLKNLAGHEVMIRHPMTYWEAEEDDAILSAQKLCSWYSVVQFPHFKTWMLNGDLTTLSEETRKDLTLYYHRVLQKIFFRRYRFQAKPPNGQKPKIYLAKSHLIDLMPHLETFYPTAKFVNICRDPKASFPSWIALAQEVGKTMATGGIKEEEAVPAHIQFWKTFFEREMAFFKDGSDANKVVINFEDFIKRREATIDSMYEKFGMQHSESFKSSLSSTSSSHSNYKKKHNYKNPTLEELGLGDGQLEEVYADYINWCSSFKLNDSNEEKEEKKKE